jgi:hypothetical protein
MSHPVSIVIYRVLLPGCESEYETSLARFYEETSGFPGLLGAHVVRPVGASREYGIMRTFADRQACEKFYASETFLRWEAEVNQLSEGSTRREELTGLEAWFAPSGARVMVAPPRWKMALGTWIGVFPTSIVLSLLISPHLLGLPFLARQLVFSGLMVALLTFLVMPMVRHALHGWLEPKPQQQIPT